MTIDNEDIIERTVKAIRDENKVRCGYSVESILREALPFILAQVPVCENGEANVEGQIVEFEQTTSTEWTNRPGRKWETRRLYRFKMGWPYD